MLLCLGCSSEAEPTRPAPDATSAEEPRATRPEFEAFFRMALRQVSEEKLDCMIEDLASTLSDEEAAEFIDSLESGGQPPRATLEIVSAAARSCGAALPT